MNGPRHWLEAESHLAAAAGIETDGDQDSTSAWHQRQAQVHATLALTVATLARGSLSLTPADWHGWQTAIDPEYAAEQAAEVTR